MKTKFYYMFAFVALLMASVNPVLSKEPKAKGPEMEVTDPTAAARLLEIESRVNEIKAMDRTNMTKAERKALKKELKELKRESRALGGGIYLSVGAVIVIILVLILIL